MLSSRRKYASSGYGLSVAFAGMNWRVRPCSSVMSSTPPSPTAATGAQRWASRYTDGFKVDLALSVAVSPVAGTVFVTGFASASDATVAYQG